MKRVRRFDGQVVWITGASSGIGAALAEAFARDGARLVLSARRRAELEQVANRCGGEALILPLDLARSDELASHVSAVLARFGRIDVLVHNGGVSQRSRVADTRLDVDRRIMEVNYFVAVALTKAVLPTMLKASSGHVVVVSSVMGKLGTPLRSAYAASKHALHGFFDCLRAETADQGLFVTLICPGYVKTDISKNALTGDGSPRQGATSSMVTPSTGPRSKSSPPSREAKRGVRRGVRKGAARAPLEASGTGTAREPGPQVRPPIAASRHTGRRI